MTRLEAVTTRVDREVDLLALAGADGVLFAQGSTGFAGQGCAARVGRHEVVEVLAAIPVVNEVGGPGTGPVAFGSLPFLPDDAVEVVIPEVVVGRRADGTTWLTLVRDPHVVPAPPDPDVALSDALATAAAQRPPGPGPAAFEVRATRPPDQWMDAVARATRKIRSGELEKVVLAREVVVTADAPISVPAVLARLARSYPGCFLYLIDGFCGASPELLVSRHDDVVRAQPMAGTAPRRGDPDADSRAAAALLASATYRHEHQITIDAVHDTLLQFSSYVDYQPEPSVVALANVVHLATSVEGRLSHPPASVLELVDALHPTPAVCGRPEAAALAAIAELEALDRGRYAGAVGWVDAQGNGQFAVAIRGALVDGDRAVVVGGNGIVADSDPTTELIETRAKMQAMLSAIVRP